MSAEVSVVVPFHNVEPYLADCLRSIAEQTFSDLDVVLINDGSTDGSRAIAADQVARDERFRLLDLPNGGVATARNTGIEATDGRYLLFVDSDDLLGPRAVEALRASLEASGSDFAAGHVWRLPLTRPLETSWAHRDLFNVRRTGVTIREYPLLMRDRMVWNKLWRRRFWDEKQLSFPDMWFEDYPVMLRAHLEARAVDLLPDPMYVWRERPSGDSISQRGVDLANVRDRVVAAEMVLGMVDQVRQHADRELRELVHSHLCDVDLREVLQSMPRVAPEDMDRMRELATRLARALDRGLLRLARPQMQRAYAAVEAGDFDAACAWAGFLLDRSYRKLARSLGGTTAARRELVADLSERARAKAGQLTTRPRSARLESLEADPDRVVLRCLVPLQASLGHAARATVTAGPVRARVRTEAGPGGAVVTAEFDTVELSVLRGRTRLEVTVSVGPLRWQGRVLCTPQDLVSTRRGGVRLQASGFEGVLHLEGLRHAVAVTDAVVVDDELLSLRLSVPDAEVVIPRSWPAEPRRARARDGVVVFPLDELVANDPADDPASRVTVRTISLVTSGTETEPLLMDAPDICVQHAGRQVRVRRLPNGRAGLVHHEPGIDPELLPELGGRPALVAASATSAAAHAATASPID